MSEQQFFFCLNRPPLHHKSFQAEKSNTLLSHQENLTLLATMHVKQTMIYIHCSC